jgi:hypothetical protein
MHVWGTGNPHAVVEMPLYPQKISVWCTVSSTGIVGPIFMDVAFNAECYLKLLEDHFIPTLQGMGVNMKETFFQQYGARPRAVNVVLHFLSKYFHNSVISN